MHVLRDPIEKLLSTVILHAMIDFVSFTTSSTELLQNYMKNTKGL